MRQGAGGKEKGRRVLAWVSFGFAAVGGAALVGTFVGGMVAGLVGFFPHWVAVAAFAGALVAMALDLFSDGEPNQIALYTAMVLPSLARAVPGKLSTSVVKASTSALAQVDKMLGAWLGTSPTVTAAGKVSSSGALGVAIVCVVVSLLMARRVLAKGGGGR